MAVKHFDILNHARFLTYSCFKRLPLLEDPAIRGLYVAQLQQQSARLKFDIIAYVVMPEHVHLIVVPEDGQVERVLRGIKQGFARDMLKRMRDEENPMLGELVGPHGKPIFWQRGGGHDRNLRSNDDVREKVAYIHMNPVRRGLVERATDWAWSSAREYDEGSGMVGVRKSL